MSAILRITLLFVVFVDLIGQGLVFPIINTLIMQPSTDFLPSATATGTRHFYFGLVIGCFFLSWFLGVVYVSKLSDSIGRKNALLICLAGALVGYALTILALYLSNVWILILGRSITGFTAGNQPIAQAAVIDRSTDAADRDRNMGYLVTGVSFGLVGGPIIGAVLSDRAILGSLATLSMPFYGAFVLVLIAIVLVLLFFKDIETERQPFVFRPRDISDSLIAIKNYPNVLALMPVYTLFMIANVTTYIFIDNYLTSAYGYGVVGGSVAMVVVGAAVATASTFFVEPIQKRFRKADIMLATLIVMTVCSLAIVQINSGVFVYVPLFVFYFFFGVAYPTVLGLFSSAVGTEDQGWVMGVTTAVFCLAGGIMSLIGGGLMALSIKLPYLIACGFAVLGVIVLLATWRGEKLQKVLQ